MTAETRWTPGPWWADPEFDETDRGYVVIAANPNAGPMPGNPTRGSVALAVRHATMPVDECRANAHLIAAAPELYEALTTLSKYCAWQLSDGTDYHPTLGSALGKARAVLAKARGEQP